MKIIPLMNIFPRDDINLIGDWWTFDIPHLPLGWKFLTAVKSINVMKIQYDEHFCRWLIFTAVMNVYHSDEIYHSDYLWNFFAMIRIIKQWPNLCFWWFVNILNCNENSSLEWKLITLMKICQFNETSEIQWKFTYVNDNNYCNNDAWLLGNKQ